MLHSYPKKRTSCTHYYVLLCVIFAFAQDSNAQTSFTESAALYNIAIDGTKDGGHAWADYDRDGDLDLLVNRLNTNSVLLRNEFIETGTASFTDMTSILTDGMNTNRERSAIFADFNNDGYPDFARNTSFEGIEIRLQHPGTHIFGDGLGGTAPYIFNAFNVSDGLNTEGMVAFDFDQDGDLDIAFDNHNFGIDLLINDGNGIFTHGTPKGPTYDINDSGTWPFGLAQDAIDGDYSAGTDYDNDGFVDIISRKNAQVDFFRNLGGQFAATSIDIDNSDNNSKGGIGFYDFDNDGDFDLFWTENGTNQIHENRNGVYVALGAATGIPTLFPGDKIEGMACGDVDNDGDIDVFLAGDDGYLYINQLNSAAGQNTGSPMSFVLDTSNTFLAGIGNGEGCTFVDFDRDGDLDLYTNISDGPNHLYINDLSNANSDKYLFVDIIENRDVFDLIGAEQRYAVGATARLVDCDGNIISGLREVNGGNGHGTQDPQRIHFGIPFEANIEIIVEVFFPTALGERRVVRMPFVPNSLGTGWERAATITPDNFTPNNGPSSSDDSYTFNYDPAEVTLTPLDNDSDSDGDPLEIMSITQPDHGSAVLNSDGTISYTPEQGYLGNVTLSYLAEDLPSCRIFSMSDTAIIDILITTTPITSNSYEEEIMLPCGEDIPEIPVLEFTGGCGDYIVEYEEVTDFVDNITDYTIVRTWTVTDICGQQAVFQQRISVMQCEPMPCNPEELIISKTITVNGDGINDVLEIKGLEACDPVYQIKVFNRWGNMVFASDDYQNDWAALAPNNAVGDSGTLPAGTYYYMLNIGDMTLKPVDGYIYIGTK